MDGEYSLDKVICFSTQNSDGVMIGILKECQCSLLQSLQDTIEGFGMFVPEIERMILPILNKE